MNAPRPIAVGDLFRRQPPQYGTRGDVYLWKTMGEQLATMVVPSSPSWFELRSVLERTYAELVGEPLTDAPGQIYIANFDPGSGMSAGQVTPRWWFTTGIPILLDRADAARGDGAPDPRR
jgi:hypothetical protein